MTICHETTQRRTIMSSCCGTATDTALKDTVQLHTTVNKTYHLAQMYNVTSCHHQYTFNDNGWSHMYKLTSNTQTQYLLINSVYE